MRLTQATSPAAYSPAIGVRPVDVRMHPAHHVMDDRSHGNHLVDRIQIGILQAQLPHERQLLVDDLLADLADVETDVGAVRPLVRTPLLELLDECLGQAIPGPELHRPQHRLWLRPAEVVVLQIPVAVLVHQPPALGPRGLGDQDPRRREPRGVILDELHVLERGSRAVRERHPVAVLDVGVGAEWEDLAAAAGAQDHGLRGDAVDLSGGNLDCNDTQTAPVVNQQPGDEPLVVALDALVLERRLEQGVQHVEAGLVGREPRPLHLHAAERPHGNAAVRLAASTGSPQCSSWTISRGASSTKASTTSWSHSQSAPDTVS